MTPAAVLLLAIAALPPAPFSDTASYSHNRKPHTGFASVVMKFADVEKYYDPKAFRLTPRAANMNNNLSEIHGECTATANIQQTLQQVDPSTGLWKGPGYPPTSDLIDRDEIYRVYYGLEVHNMNLYEWPSNYPKEIEAINHLKATYQILHASWLRDFGFDARIEHVHFEDGIIDLNESWYMWDELEPRLGHPIQGVFILKWATQGGAWASTCNLGLGRAWASYSFMIPPTGIYPYGGYLIDLAQEWGHSYPLLGHRQCMHDYNGDSLVHCHESGCYEGNDECPPYDDISYMDYCAYSCYTPWAANHLPYAPPRLGKIADFTPAQRIALHNAKALGDMCLGPPVERINFAVEQSNGNPDGDEYHGKFDNCRAVANNDQLDADMDGWGDACDHNDGCQDGPPMRFAWALTLMPVALVFGRKFDA